MKRGLVIALLGFLAAADFTAFAQTARERGIGPYTLVTRRGDVPVRLLRRDGDMVWVDRMVQSGQYIETGVPRSEIVEFKAPPHPAFAAAAQAQTPEQIAAAIDGLRRLVAQLRPYRDLPGIPVNAALIEQAKLNERRAYWRDALLIYQELLNQPYDFPERPMIRYWSGMNHWRMDQKDKALEFLLDDPVPDEDLDLMSDILYMRADSLAATGRAREAVETYLGLIVFYPFVQTNELRALSGVIPNYIALQDWDATVKSIEALKRDYPDAPQTAAAVALLETYTQEVEKERQFQVREE
jgi:hypothetical protein